MAGRSRLPLFRDRESIITVTSLLESANSNGRFPEWPNLRSSTNPPFYQGIDYILGILQRLPEITSAPKAQFKAISDYASAHGIVVPSEAMKELTQKNVSDLTSFWMGAKFCIEGLRRRDRSEEMRKEGLLRVLECLELVARNDYEDKMEKEGKELEVPRDWNGFGGARNSGT